VAPTVPRFIVNCANYITREIFATKREELRTSRHGDNGAPGSRNPGGEVLLRDLKLPEEYAQGLEGLLLKEQENERIGTERRLSKQVRIAELEAGAEGAGSKAGGSPGRFACCRLRRNQTPCSNAAVETEAVEQTKAGRQRGKKLLCECRGGGAGQGD